MKKYLSALIFSSICVFLFVQFNNIYSYRYYGNWSIEGLYRLQKDSVDVIAAGDSHVLTTINPAIIWENQGVPCFTVSSEGQDIWITYYRLVEALKTQNPKLIIVDVHNAVNDNQYSNDASGVMGLLGMRLSCNKIQAVHAAVTPDKYVDYLLEFPIYHSRYAQLTKYDFERNYGDVYLADMKGFQPLFHSGYEACISDISEVTGTIELNTKMEEYLYKIIQLTTEHKIPLLLIAAPYCSIDGAQQMKFNRIGEIAESYGIPFINFNMYLSEIGLVPEDFADPHHLDYNGAEKFSDFLGRYIMQHYSLMDKRGNAEYQSWDKNALDYHQLIMDYELDNSGTLDSFIEKSDNAQYTVVISMSKVDRENETVQPMLERFGIDKDNFRRNGLWVIHEGTIVAELERESADTWQWVLGESDLEVTLGYECTPVTMYDGTNYAVVDNGINVFVYNNYRNCVAGYAGFLASEDFKLYK